MTSSDALAAHYSGYYDGTSRWRELGAVDKALNVRRMWSSAGAAPRPSIIDIGCGEGAMAGALAGFYSTYRGFDLSTSAPDAARSRHLDGVLFESFDGIRLPVGDKAANLALLTHVVEHLEHPRMLLQEAARVAQFVFVEVPLEYHWRTSRNFVWTTTGHINLYTPKLIRQLVQSIGLTVVAEAVTNPGRAVLSYKSGRRGLLQWGIREVALRVAKPVATNVFTYHGCLLATTSGPDATSLPAR